jgi:hypothetical protein
MKTYKIHLTESDINVILSWFEDRIGSGHWGDNIVLSDEHAELIKKLENKTAGSFTFSSNQINQIIHDAEKCFSGKYGMFNPVGSVLEIATLYKMNKTIGKGSDFLKNWELTEQEINSWINEYS